MADLSIVRQVPSWFPNDLRAHVLWHLIQFDGLQMLAPSLWPHVTDLRYMMSCKIAWHMVLPEQHRQIRSALRLAVVMGIVRHITIDFIVPHKSMIVEVSILRDFTSLVEASVPASCPIYVVFTRQSLLLGLWNDLDAFVNVGVQCDDALKKLSDAYRDKIVQDILRHGL